MRNTIIIVSITIVLIVSAFFLMRNFSKNESIIIPISENIPQIIEKPLAKYSFPTLKRQTFEESQITLGEKLKDEDDFEQYIFYFTVEGKKVSGLANIPKNTPNPSIIIMLRGFVDPKVYKTGIGTIRAGEQFTKAGFITLAPDFLGYGESDDPSEIVMEERFQTYVTILTLLASVKNLPNANAEKIGIWGHSNGGHIALSVLEITGYEYPTILWAPVSKPFPYSILYYTDEFEDHGKLLRKVVADFEKDYDVELYSPSNYYEWIETPIEIHQGGADMAVPQVWSDNLVKALEDLDKEVEYFTYPGDDHNFALGNWQTVVDRNITFYKNNLTN